MDKNSERELNQLRNIYEHTMGKSSECMTREQLEESLSNMFSLDR